MTQTLQQAGYKHIYYTSETKQHGLINIETGLIELFTAKKDLSGWGLKYRNTKLEFNSSFDTVGMERFIKGLMYFVHYGEQHPSFKEARKVLLKLGKY